MSDAVIEALRGGVRVFDLAQALTAKTPVPASHPGFRMALMRRHGDIVRDDGVSTANEMMMLGGHSGTHVDGLSHVSCDGHLFGGVVAADVQGPLGFSAHGIESMEPVVTRGVLLDMCAYHGVERLPNGHPITPDEMMAQTQRAGVEIGKGDAVLVRTGWAQLWDDPVAFIGLGQGVPGPTPEGCEWLASKGVRLVGSDTTSFELVQAVRPSGLPGHRVLLVENGIHIMEMMNLEMLAAAGVAEFMFVLGPLKIVGATGSPARPLAVIAA
jgi:kynurenine formamidase